MEQDMVKMWKSDAYNWFIYHTFIHDWLINLLKLNMKLDPARYVVSNQQNHLWWPMLSYNGF